MHRNTQTGMPVLDQKDEYQLMLNGLTEIIHTTRTTITEQQKEEARKHYMVMTLGVGACDMETIDRFLNEVNPYG